MGMKTKINKIEDIDKSNPFKVPDNYFAQFNENIMSRLPEKEVLPERKITVWDKMKPWVYMAAMFLGLFFMIKTVTNNRTGTANVHPLSSTNLASDNYWSTVKISEEEFYQYLEEQIIEDGLYDYIYDEFYSVKSM